MVMVMMMMMMMKLNPMKLAAWPRFGDICHVLITFLVVPNLDGFQIVKYMVQGEAPPVVSWFINPSTLW